MIGNSSSYPETLDDIFQMLDENYTGTAVTDEEHTIPSDSVYQVTLKHYAKTDTFSIDGYSRVAAGSTLNSKEFMEVDFAVPTLTQTGIDYDIGNVLEFYSGDAGDKVKVNYTSPGNKVDANNYNRLADAIYKIQVALGTMGQNKDVELYSTTDNLCKLISYMLELIKTHTHAGGTKSSTFYSKQLSSNSIADATWSNAHISPTAAIAQTKLSMGVKSQGTGSIPSGTTFLVDVTDSSYSYTDSDRVRIFRGVKGLTDSEEVGSLAFDPVGSTVDGTFRVKFFTDEATIVTGVPFFYEIYTPV